MINFQTISQIVFKILAVAFFLFSSFAAHAQLIPICTPGTTPHLMTGTSSNGLTRAYTVHVPPNGPATMPVVYAFHGSTNNPLLWPSAGEADLVNYANQADVIIVAPVAQATPYSNGKLEWYAGDQIGSMAGDPLHHDDNIFMEDLISLIDAQPCTEEARYAMGHSAGSGFAMQMACLQNDKFKAIGGAALAFFDSSCTGNGNNMPFLYIHNMRDTKVPLVIATPHFYEYAARHGCYRAKMKPDNYWDPSIMYDYRCTNVDIRFHRLAFQKGKLGTQDHAWPTIANSGENATQVIFEFFGLLP